VEWNGDIIILNNGEKNVFRFDDDRSFNSVRNATSLLGNIESEAFVKESFLTPQHFAKRRKTAPYLLSYIIYRQLQHI
jgi:hypothetical protein